MISFTAVNGRKLLIKEDKIAAIMEHESEAKGKCLEVIIDTLFCEANMSIYVQGDISDIADRINGFYP